MNEAVERLVNHLSVDKKLLYVAEKKIEHLLKTHPESDIDDSIGNYMMNNQKPEFWKWFNAWESFKTNYNTYKDNRPVRIMNDVMTLMEHRLQYHFGNKDLSKYQRIEKYHDMNAKLEFFEISKSGKINMKTGYIQQFYDFIFEKMNERISSEYYKTVNGLGIEGFFYYFLADAYYDLANWKKSVSDVMDYPLNDIIKFVLESRSLAIDYLNNALSKIGVK